MKKDNLGLPKRGVSGFSSEVIEHGFEHARLEKRQNLLDHFAGLAMQGILSRGSVYSPEGVAKRAYEVANKMLKAREEEM